MVSGLNKNNPVFKVSTSADFDRRIISKIYKDPVIRNKEKEVRHIDTDRILLSLFLHFPVPNLFRIVFLEKNINGCLLCSKMNVTHEDVIKLCLDFLHPTKVQVDPRSPLGNPSF